jgi:hypothetical protein
MVTKTIAAITTFAVFALPAVASAGGIFGTYPINISVAPNGAPANGSSSAPAVSGDNRKTRFAAFESDATNLVGGDTNGKRDIFVWSRPSGGQGLTLRQGAGSLQRVSVASDGTQANGDSFGAALDGSVSSVAHCVAFQSAATNLAPGDADTTTDIFVRDLRAKQTFLVSRGISGAASDPSIDGACSKVVYVSGNQIVVQPVRAGNAKVIGAGRNPDFSLDGRAVTWEQGSNVVFVRDGKKTVVGPGAHPTVTDAERLHGQLKPSWGVSFDSPAALSSKDHNPGIDTYLRVFGPSGGPKRTDLISFAQPKVHFDGKGDNYSGGITAYGTNRGILTFVHSGASATDAYYWNQHTGNADDTAHAATLNGEAGITEMVTSARANFIAFTSSFTGSMATPFSGGRGLSVESLSSPNQSVYFKMLVDGEAI